MLSPHGYAYGRIHVPNTRAEYEKHLAKQVQLQHCAGERLSGLAMMRISNRARFHRNPAAQSNALTTTVEANVVEPMYRKTAARILSRVTRVSSSPSSDVNKYESALKGPRCSRDTDGFSIPW
jgi:predicted secreted Zn-dependent protease